MQVGCPNCGHVLNVPPEKAAVPNLKAKCRCGTIFPVSGPPGTAAAAPRTPPAAAPRTPPAAAPRTPLAATSAAPAAARPRAVVPPAVVMAAGAEALTPPPLPKRAPGVPPGAPVRTAAAVPRPAPAPSTPPAPMPATAADTPRPAAPGVSWHRCQSHPQARSEHVCPKCAKGFCGACGQKVQNAVICPACEGLCVAASAYELSLQQARQRDRSMTEEIAVIAAYPLRDRMAYVMLALFTWFFGLFSGFGAIMFVLSKGVLTWYSFNALSKVSIGNMRDVMPEFRDLSDITTAMRLSVAALAVSAGPLVLCAVLIPGAGMLADSWTSAPPADVVRAQEPPAEEAPEAGDDDEEEIEANAAAGEGSGGEPDASVFEAEREGTPSVAAPLAVLALVLGAIWMIAYMPVALTVAGLSKSILSTINPLIGIDTIKKMGGTYWQALGIYAVLVVAEFALGRGLALIPIAGGFVRAFVEAYAALAIGCTLGLAVFKKAAVLGWD